MATEFQAKVQARLPKQSIELVATEYAGHAEELAYALAKKAKRPLIMSASGDGGYHEVVNGLMQAKHEGYDAVAGLLPAGNANDHYHNLHEREVIDAIADADETRIDLLKVSATAQGQPFERYGHSYVGFGLTPKAGRELNKTKLNFFNQLWIVLKVFIFVRPTRLKVDGKIIPYDSLIFSNVTTMSKVVTLSKASRINDGKFEVTAFRRRHKLLLIILLLKASLVGLSEDKQVDSFELETVKVTAIQIDGEVMTIDARSTVQVAIAHNALQCIV